MKLRELHWSLYFFFWVAVITGAGALLGAVLFPLVGLFFHTGYTPGQLVLNGGRIGGFYAGIWAPGTAVVLCIMRAYQQQHPQTPASD